MPPWTSVLPRGTPPAAPPCLRLLQTGRASFGNLPPETFGGIFYFLPVVFRNASSTKRKVRHLKSWEFFLHDLHRADGHIQLVDEVLSEIAKLEVPVGGPGALGRLVTLHLHHHLEQGCFTRPVFTNCKQG